MADHYAIPNEQICYLEWHLTFMRLLQSLLPSSPPLSLHRNDEGRELNGEECKKAGQKLRLGKQSLGRPFRTPPQSAAASVIANEQHTPEPVCFIEPVK